MSKELLTRVLMARTIGYPLPPSLVKDIEAELAKPEQKTIRVLARTHPDGWVGWMESPPNFTSVDITNATLILDEGVEL
jgi:hypothetical protein